MWRSLEMVEMANLGVMLLRMAKPGRAVLCGFLLWKVTQQASLQSLRKDFLSES